MPQSRIAERLLVHAGLCRRLAAASLDENLAAKFLRMASECAEAATGRGEADEQRSAPQR
ncbi:hypothetical protein [Undibacter mobilis]|uniref:Uncharacterized protein n=1 Tax=Undibacter mobilis TaxID=2292256 RepID=A0A371BC65_9BRAD|nr:hypothetical protein [Undibacter mobilis]RDV05150.1 hypothetical protein DXH78_11595 [Undibacter mobilis]